MSKVQRECTDGSRENSPVICAMPSDPYQNIQNKIGHAMKQPLLGNNSNAASNSQKDKPEASPTPPVRVTIDPDMLDHSRYLSYHSDPVPPTLVDQLGGKPLSDYAKLSVEFGSHEHSVLVKFIANSKLDDEDPISMSVVHKTTKKNRLAMLLGVGQDDEQEKDQHTEPILGPGLFKLKPFQGNDMWALHYNLGPPVASQIDPLILKVLVLFVHKDAVDGPMKVLHRFVEEAMEWEKQNCEKHEVQLFHFDVRTSRWRLISSKRGRPMASVFLPALLKDRITGDMERFLSKRSVRWYHRHGVPYKRSYLFYGPPGSGKTSFIQALAYKFQRQLCFLQPSSPTFTDDSLMIAIQSSPMNSIIVLEDIDALFSKNRDSKCAQMAVTFSGLLNALDGMANPDGQIFFLTTNHVERLDPALIRHGRVDLRVEFAMANDEQLIDIFNSFLEDSACDSSLPSVCSSEVSPADDNGDNKPAKPTTPKKEEGYAERSKKEREAKAKREQTPESEHTPLTDDEKAAAVKDWVSGWRKQFRYGVSMATVQQLLIQQMGGSPRDLINAIKGVSIEESKVHSNDCESLYC